MRIRTLIFAQFRCRPLPCIFSTVNIFGLISGVVSMKKSETRLLVLGLGRFFCLCSKLLGSGFSRLIRSSSTIDDSLWFFCQNKSVFYIILLQNILFARIFSCFLNVCTVSLLLWVNVHSPDNRFEPNTILDWARL